MIGRVVSRPKRAHELLVYLFGPGRNDEHVSPQLVAAWPGDCTHLEPPGTGTENRPTWRLAQILEVPIAQALGMVPEKLAWHCVVRAADADRRQTPGEWQVICAEVMHRTGLSEHGQEDKGVRWVAVHHGGNHVHIVAVLARMDGRPVRLRGDWYRVQEAMAWAEKEFGLTPVARAGPRGTAARRPVRAETEKAARLARAETEKTGRAVRPVPARSRLRRLVEAAVAAARTEEEFFAALAARDVRVHLRPSAIRPDEVTGYAVGLRSDTTGKDGGPVWYSGRRLAPDLTLPGLRARWATGPGRLTGQGMSEQAAQPVLAREVFRAARAARSEQEFLDRLAGAGLLVRLRPDPGQPGRPAFYFVTLPDLGGAGQSAWFAGSSLDPKLGLERLRARWAAGRTGAAPGPDQFAGADAGQVYAYAAVVAQRAATELKTARGARRADIAWAAADLLTSAAWATGSAELHRATDGFRRAARAPWGRAPAVRSPVATMLRTAAYLLAACAPVDRHSAVCRALIAALTLLARAITEMRRERLRYEQARRIREEHAWRFREPKQNRKDQIRSLQAEAAKRAAEGLAAVAGPTWGADPATVAVSAANRASPEPRRSASALTSRHRPAAT